MNTSDSTGKVLVNSKFKYKKIDDDAPRGIKVILANRSAGVATFGIIDAKAKEFFTHYAELPVFEEDE